MRDKMIFVQLAVFILVTMGPVGLSRGRESQSTSAARQTVKLEVTRDAWVSQVGQEADGNNGGAPRLKLKSIQEMSLIDIDARPLVGRVIRSAALHMKKAGDEILRRVTVSSVAALWFEGTGQSYAIEPGGVTFRHRRHPDLPWAIDGGDLCACILGNGGTTWRMADASPPDEDGWQRIAVDPAILAARTAGLSYGFLVFDDTGSEWTRAGETFTLRLFPNRFVYSRDQNRAVAPYFTVELGPEDHRPPAAPDGLRVEPATALLPAGEASVSWLTPRDNGSAGTLGFVATLDGGALPRELIPPAGAAGTRARMHVRDLKLSAGATVTLEVRAVDGAGNVGPAVTAAIKVSSRIPAPLPRPKPASARQPLERSPAVDLPQIGAAPPVFVAIIDELDKVNPSTGLLIPSQPEAYHTANHLWDAARRRITLQAARNEFIAFQIWLRKSAPLPAGLIVPELTFEGPAGRVIKIESGRYHPVASKIGPLPDPIVPLGALTAADAARVKNESLHVEIYVPHELAAGEYHGTLALRRHDDARAAQGTEPQALQFAVLLRVWDFTLPDHLGFLPEMNCYGLPENERDYYRLAHRHRTVLNRLPYNQNGRMQEGCAPRWDSERLSLDWSAWDRRFGPLLDGSAFADSPRKGVPVECFYLPLHENWPSPMEGNYDGSYWADHAFPESYRRAFVAAARQIALHFQDKRWTDTLFHGFLNNKNNFKANGWSRGSSPWLLDEPANFQDYWALRYFARAFHEGINLAAGSGSKPADRRGLDAPSPISSPSPRLVFRADISRPQWRRDSLDGLLDYHVVGGAMRSYPRLVFERKRALGEIVLEYGSTNPVDGSNVQPAAWCLDTWSLGADGVIPWQTVGTRESWTRADELSLFYPGRGPTSGAGPNTPRAPIPSIRLKAYRRGQQDVEYLTLWSQLHDEPRWAVGGQVRAALKLTGTRQATGMTVAEDAGRIDYGKLRPQDLWALRVAIGAALSEARPAYRSKLVEFRTPRRDPDHSPPAYVDDGGAR
jgi:Domain of unknown function (DUF4091)